MEALRLRARERIEQGCLPRVKAVRTWGGLGTGLRCDLCDAAISSSEPEFELQLDLASGGEPVRFHRLCHTIWSEVREESQPGTWRAVSRELPTSGAVVEARVSLGERRSIILSVVYLNVPPSPGEWLNATTGGPLPEGWHPIEWRPLAGASSGASSGAGMGGDQGKSGPGPDAIGSAPPFPRRA